MKILSIFILAILLCVVSCQSSDTINYRSFSEKCEDSIISENASTAELVCNLTYPIGRTNADVAIRKWLNQAIMLEFSATHENDYTPQIKLSQNGDNLQEAFRDYSLQYYRWVKKEYSDEQGILYPLHPFYVHFSAHPVVDNARYVTFYVEADISFAGAHGAPHSYYRTYDKKLNEFVSCDMLIKKEHFKDVCQAMYKNAMKTRQEKINREIRSLTTDFTDDYPCEKWSGNNDESMKNDNGMIPLQHVAILPQGIVASYHPYNIGGLAEEDYHITVPFKDIAGYLLQDYTEF